MKLKKKNIVTAQNFSAQDNSPSFLQDLSAQERGDKDITVISQGEVMSPRWGDKKKIPIKKGVVLKMKEKGAITVMAMLILSTIVMAADDTITTAPAGEMDAVSEATYPSNSYAFTQTIGNATGMDEYRWYDEDFCWTHTFSAPGATILDINLTIRAWDVDYTQGERDTISVDGNDLGDLQGSDGTWSETTFSVSPSALADGNMQVCIDIDSTNNNDTWAVTVDWSKIDVEYDYLAAPEFTSIGIALAILLSSPAFAYLLVKRHT